LCGRNSGASLSSALARRRPGALVALPLARELVEEAARNARRSLSEATKRAYATSWARFEAWCAAHGLPALPADEPTVVTYLTAAAAGYELEGEDVPPLQYRSLERLYAAVRVQHEEAGCPLGTLKGVRNTMKTIGRKAKEGIAPKQKRGFKIDQVVAAVKLLTADPFDVRARAVLLFGWIIGQRRSSIAALQLEDVEFTETKAVVTIRRSKTDQLGEGHTIVVKRRGGRYCAIEAVEDWLAVRNRDPEDRSLLGVSDVTVNVIVKRAAASLGLNPKEYGAHSLRRGYVTSMSRAGKDVASIMDVTGHDSVEQVRGYIEKDPDQKEDIAADLFAEYDKEDMAAKRTYVPESEDKSLKATLSELAGPILTKQAPPVVIHEATGQPLVDRRVTQEMRRRVVKAPDFLRDGKPADVAVLKTLAKRLESKGRSLRLIVTAMKAVKVTRGDGSALTAEDVTRWLA
jgi:integrase